MIIKRGKRLKKKRKEKEKKKDKIIYAPSIMSISYLSYLCQIIFDKLSVNAESKPNF